MWLMCAALFSAPLIERIERKKSTKPWRFLGIFHTFPFIFLVHQFTLDYNVLQWHYNLSSQIYTTKIPSQQNKSKKVSHIGHVRFIWFSLSKSNESILREGKTKEIPFKKDWGYLNNPLVHASFPIVSFALGSLCCLLVKVHPLLQGLCHAAGSRKVCKKTNTNAHGY